MQQCSIAIDYYVGQRRPAPSSAAAVAMALCSSSARRMRWVLGRREASAGSDGAPRTPGRGLRRGLWG
jgi:hypothetical protein